jgi:hypothetical protein
VVVAAPQAIPVAEYKVLQVPAVVEAVAQELRMEDLWLLVAD